VVWSAVVGLVVALTVGAAGLGWAVGDRAARRATLAVQVRDSLNAARALLAANRMTAAREKLAEARAHVGSDRAALAALVEEVEAGEAELDRFQQLLELIDRAHQAETAPVPEAAGAATSPPATTVARQRAEAVPFLLQALARYEVLERDDWATRLEGGLLGEEQIKHIRRLTYEELLWLADDVLLRHQAHRAPRQLSREATAGTALVYLAKAESAHRPTLAFYELRARCRQTLGEEAAARADYQLADRASPTLAVDHYLRGQAAYRARQQSAGVEAFEAALRVEPTHYWSLMRLGYCLCDLGQGPKDFAGAARVFTGCLLKRPDHAHAYYCRAVAYKKLHRYEDVVTDCSQAVNLDPKYAPAWDIRGYAHYHLGHHDKALADFSKALELDPEGKHAWHGRGLVYAKLGQWDKAVAEYSRAIELHPKDVGAWNGRGHAYEKLGQWDKAFVNYSQAIKLDPNNAEAWTGRGYASSDLGRPVQALADFSRALELDPESTPALIGRGNTYGRDLRQYDKAIADFSRAIELDPWLAKSWNNRGNDYRNLGQYDRAVADTTQAIELDSTYALAWTSRGHAYRCLGQYDKAIADYSQAIALNPKDARAWTNRGCVYCDDLGQWDKAVTDFIQAIALNPKDAKVWTNRGNAYRYLGQWDKAVTDYSQAIALNPRFVPAWGGRGLANRDLGQYDKAVTDFTQAIALNPKDALAWTSRGCVYCDDLDQYDKAVTDFSRALELDPKHARAYYLRARAWSLLAHYAQARADFQTFLELAPANAYSHNALAWLLATCPDDKLRDPQQAVRLADKAVQLAPEAGACWRTLGVAHYRAGDWQAAGVALGKSVELENGGNAVDWLFLAMAHRKLGHHDEARRRYNQAVEWMEKNKPALEKGRTQAEYLRRFRGEAEDLLDVRPRGKGLDPS
jgi:tetratricopeptide (TPR) repeat protein